MKKILALVLVLVCSVQLVAFAADFKDMPKDWSTTALEAAVKNGLLTGDNGYIKASDNMTRAEMATIVVRACGATATTDISKFTDVGVDDWYYDSMSKAVAMGAFNGSDGKLNPNNPITRQEAFVVLSRVFGIAVGSNVNKQVLNDFKDKGKIADWAQGDVAAIVEQGYVSGNNGYINPLSNISRAEFAVVMDRMIKYYIDAPMEALPTDGNIMIRANGISLDGFKSDKLVVVGDAVADETIIINDANLSNKLVMRAGKNISAGGNFNSIVVLSQGATLASGAGHIARVYLGKDCVFDTFALPTAKTE